MDPLSPATARVFCEYCDWAHRCWMLRRSLYDDNPKQHLLNRPRNKYLFVQLEKVLQEYWLHQVAKLHDPALQSGRRNLTIDYVVNHARWESRVSDDLVTLSASLEELSKAIRGARNRLLAHNDLEAILSQVNLGAFDPGVAETYFNSLQQMASLVHEEVIGGPYVFDDLIPNDVDQFMAAMEKGSA